MTSRWPLVALDEILTQDRSYIDRPDPMLYPKLSVKLYGRGVVLDTPTEGASLRMQRHQLAKAGQVILSEIWGKKGAIGIVPPEGNGALCTSHFFLFDIRRDRVEPGYLQALFSSNHLEQQLDSEARGTTGYAAVRPQHLLAAQVPLPPLSEQRRIVARLAELTGRVAKAREIGASSDDQAASLLDAIVGRRLADTWDRKRGTLFNRTTKIGSGSTPAGGIYSDSGTPFIRSLNVRMRHFSSDRLEFIDEATHTRMAGTRVQPGDVLLNITGASIGRVTCFPPELVEGNVSQHVAIIRPDRELRARFLMYWLSQPSVQRLILETQKGATKQGFTKAQIEKIEIPSLSPEDQDEIVSDLDRQALSSDRLVCAQRVRSAGLEALGSAILARAFAGEL